MAQGSSQLPWETQTTKIKSQPSGVRQPDTGSWRQNKATSCQLVLPPWPLTASALAITHETHPLGSICTSHPTAASAQTLPRLLPCNTPSIFQVLFSSLGGTEAPTITLERGRGGSPVPLRPGLMQGKDLRKAFGFLASPSYPPEEMSARRFNKARFRTQVVQ